MKKIRLHISEELDREVLQSSKFFNINKSTFYRMAIYHGCVRMLRGYNPKLRNIQEKETTIEFHLSDELMEIWEESVSAKYKNGGDEKIKKIYRYKKKNNNKFYANDFLFYRSRLFEVFIRDEIESFNRLYKLEVDNNKTENYIKSKNVNISIPACVSENIDAMNQFVGLTDTQLYNYIFMLGYHEELVIGRRLSLKLDENIDYLCRRLKINNDNRLKFCTMLSALKRTGYISYDEELLNKIFPNASSFIEKQ